LKPNRCHRSYRRTEAEPRRLDIGYRILDDVDADQGLPKAEEGVGITSIEPEIKVIDSL
jgi:hypothetical protein